MRNYILFCFLLFSSISRAIGEKDTVLTFSIDDFRLFYTDRGTSIQPISCDYMLSSDVKKPALPIINCKIPIDKYDEIKDFTFEMGNEIAFENISMCSNPELLSTQEIVLSKNPLSFVDFEDGVYPEKSIEYAGTHFVEKDKCLFFAVSPFRYDSKSHILYLARSVKLKISISQNLSTTKQSYINRLGRMTGIPSDYDYIVITNDSLASIYQELVDWKSQKGVKAGIVLKKDIFNCYGGNMSNSQKIKSFLVDYYNNGNQKLKYVLLGGNNDSIPSFLCRVWFYKKDQQNIADTLVYTDTYYSSLKNVDWSSLNSNSNSQYGTYSDSLDLMPDIAVARIPFSQKEDVRKIIQRFINYETFPKTSNWKDTILISGKKLTNNPYYIINGNNVSDAQYLSEKMYNKYIHPFWNNKCKRLFDTMSDIPGISGFTSSNLNGEFSKGYTFVNVDTHGSEISWKTDNGSYLYFEVPNFVNSSYSVITTTACHTNAFENVCLSKSFLKAENGSILAYWGSSREGWYSSDSIHVGPSRQYIGEMYNSLFTDNFHRLGVAVKNAKNNLIGYTDFNYVPYRFLHLSMNLLGDPEMPIYTSSPTRFSNVQINTSDNQLYVYSGFSDCTYCKSVNTTTYSDYYVSTYYGGVTFPKRPGDQCNICVTYPNYVPYQAIVNNSVYLQNMKFKGDCHILASDSTTVGGNVTNIFPVGNVVIESGITRVNLANNVTIVSDFEVKKGAEFIIE